MKMLNKEVYLLLKFIAKKYYHQANKLKSKNFTEEMCIKLFKWSLKVILSLLKYLILQHILLLNYCPAGYSSASLYFVGHWLAVLKRDGPLVSQGVLCTPNEDYLKEKVFESDVLVTHRANDLNSNAASPV